MNKQKLISVLQSRIAKRRNFLGGCWEYWHTLCNMDYLDAYIKVKDHAIKLGIEQKEDKAILKQLVEDERSIKEWKARFGRYAKLPPIEGDLIAGMRKG